MRLDADLRAVLVLERDVARRGHVVADEDRPRPTVRPSAAVGRRDGELASHRRGQRTRRRAGSPPSVPEVPFAGHQHGDPAASAAATTSASRTEPPGWTTAVTPAAASTSRPSGNGKKASLAAGAARGPAPPWRPRSPRPRPATAGRPRRRPPAPPVARAMALEDVRPQTRQASARSRHCWRVGARVVTTPSSRGDAGTRRRPARARSPRLRSWRRRRRARGREEARGLASCVSGSSASVERRGDDDVGLRTRGHRLGDARRSPPPEGHDAAEGRLAGRSRGPW